MSKDVKKQMSQQAFFDFFNQFGPTPDNYIIIVLEELFKKLLSKNDDLINPRIVNK